MTTQIQLRRGTALEWSTANPVLAQGEPAYELDTGNLKIGDGITAWASLPYRVGPSQGLTAAGTISSSQSFPTLGTAKLTRYFVDVTAGNVTLTAPAVTPNQSMPAIEFVVVGTGTNTCTIVAGAGSIVVQGAASVSVNRSIVVRPAPFALNTWMVAA